MPANSDGTFEPSTDELLANNAHYVETFADHDLALQPRRKLAIVACMDSRMDIFEMLGLAHGDAHVIRNAGGIVTDDVIRSLVLSQRLLGTREIILLHHTDCGLQQLIGDTLKDDIEAETGLRPSWAFEGSRTPIRTCDSRSAGSRSIRSSSTSSTSEASSIASRTGTSTRQRSRALGTTLGAVRARGSRYLAESGLDQAGHR